MINIKYAKNKITFEGNLIFENAQEVKKLLLEKLDMIAAKKPLTVELSGVVEIDSSGIQLLISFFKSLEGRQIGYKIMGISDEMEDVLTISGLTKYFKLEV